VIFDVQETELGKVGMPAREKLTDSRHRGSTTDNQELKTTYDSEV
jgi:hypothetical protein